MSESATIIYLVMLAMLDAYNASPEKVEEADGRIQALASAIDAETFEGTLSDPDDFPPERNPIRLITMAFHESRVMYDHSDGWAEDSSGSCGPFQQIPRYVHPRELRGTITCADLQDPEIATRAVVAKLSSMIRRWGSDLDASICHYQAGNVCDETGLEYAERHLRMYRQVERHFDRIVALQEAE